MSKAKILIVEDEVITALDIKLDLERIGYEVVGITITSEEAIISAKENKPDLILMDIFIKGELNGIEVVEELKSLNIPVIYITANTNQNVLSQVSKTEPAGIITKPFNKIELEELVINVLQK